MQRPVARSWIAGSMRRAWDVTRLPRRSWRATTYLTLMGLGSAAALVKAVMFAWLLGAADFGYYALALTASSYAMYLLGFGLRDGMLPVGSLMFGKRQHDELTRLRDESITAVAVWGLGTAAVLGAIVFYLVPVEREMRWALVLAGALSLAIVEFNLVCTDLRVRQRILGFSGALLARNVLAIALGGVGAVYAGFTGAVLGETAANLVLFASVAGAVSPRVRVRTPGGRNFWALARTGVPLAGHALARSLNTNVDRWFVAFSLGAQQLGQYAFAMLGLNVALAVMNPVAEALGPRWLSEHGARSDLARVLRQAHATSLVLGAVFVAGAAVAALALPALLREFFPAYQAASGLILIVAAGALLHVVNMYDWVAMAAGRGDLLLKISLTVSAVVTLLSWIGAREGYGLTYFALVFVLGRALALVMAWWTTSALAARA